MKNKIAKITLVFAGLFVVSVVVREIVKGTARAQKSMLVVAEDKSLDALSLDVIKQIKNRFFISICYTPGNFPKTVESPHGIIRYEEADFSQIERFMLLLKSELLIYPDDIMKKSMIKNFVLCKNLSMNGNMESGIAGFDHNTVYIDVENGSESYEYQKLKLHHEIFHMIDYQDDFEIYSDNGWQLLNEDGFVYKNQQNVKEINLKITNEDQKSFFSEKKGFLLNHSMTGVEEDKAVMYSFIVSFKQYLDARATEDEIIKSKRDYMKNILIGFSPNFIHLLEK